MIFKVVIFALVAYFLYRLFMNDRKKSTKDSVQEKERMVATGDMVKDPICGAYVEAEGGITVRNGDTVKHFCSYECRDKYIKQIEEQGKIDS